MARTEVIGRVSFSVLLVLERVQSNAALQIRPQVVRETSVVRMLHR